MILRPAPLTKAAFVPFGDVIEAEGARRIEINDGMCTRFHDLAALDLTEAGGRPLVSLFRSRAWALPLALRLLERHPLSSQAFVPLGSEPFLVAVAPPGETPRAESVRVFRTDGRQGVNLRRGVWHHPLIALAEGAEFLVIDRGAGDEAGDETGDENCDIYRLDHLPEPLVVEG